MASLSRELRQSSRLRLVMPALCRHEGGVVRALVQDISREGIFLRLAEYVPPGSISGVELALPEEATPLVLAVSARFVGRTPHGFGVGMRIVEPAPAERQRWERFYTALQRGARSRRATSSGRVLVAARALPAGLVERLVAQGLAVISARDNSEVLDRVRPNSNDVVLAELHDARLSGAALCEGLKRRRALARIAVVLVTDSGAASDFLAGLDAGADYVIARPFSAEYCASRILAAARQREPSGPRAEPGPAAGPRLYTTESGARLEPLRAPSAVPACLVHAADRIADACFLLKGLARNQLRRLKQRWDAPGR
ncbi:MAG: response regulator [Polyangia bacterium]